MTAKPPQAVLWGRLAWHPAVQAWTAFTGESAVPEQIEVLRRGKKSATFRLVGAGPNGESIIAQRSRPAKASVERTIYEDILPGLHLPAPRVYGSRADDDDDYVWLFLQDLGNERYSPTDPAHRALAGRWIGMLHARARDLPLARVLPDGGPARYRRHLRAGRHAIRVNVANPLLAAADVVLLDRLAKTLDRVEGDWDRLDETCTRTPATLVHGDIQRKNMYVRAGDDGKEPALYVIDWETAGWGVPAVDLPKIDLPAYCDTVRSAWPGVRLEDVRRLAAVGVVFLQLAAIHWVSPELAYDRADHLVRPMSWLRVLYERLEQGLADLRGLS